MKKLFIYITLIALVVSCSKEYGSDEYGGYEMMTDYMLNEYETGAALRQISTTGEYQAASPGSSVVNWTFEPHDKEGGALTENVQVYISMGGAEVLYQTINRADMYDGPVGLPRFDFSLSLSNALASLGVPVKGGATVNVRFVLNLTNGESYSRSSVTGSMTGAYFRSPYLYPLVVKCDVLVDGSRSFAGTYTISGSDSWGDGWNGASVDFIIDGVKQSFTLTEGAAKTGTIEVPASASTLAVQFTSGDWDSEVGVSITYANPSGESQLSMNYGFGVIAPGNQVMSICE